MFAHAKSLPSERQSHLIDIGLLLCCCAIVYTTLYPWSGWRWPTYSVWRYLSDPWPRYWSWFDVLSNLAAYVPVGVLLAARWRPRWRGFVIIVMVLIAAGLFSLALETLQNLLPKRVPSRLDLVLNAAGAALGALTALLLMQRPNGTREIIWHRPIWLAGESWPFLAIVAVWLVSQLAAQRILFETGAIVSPAVQLLSSHVDQAPGIVRPDIEFAALLAPLLEQLQLSQSYSMLLEAMSVAIAIACIGLILVDAVATQRMRVIAVVTVLLTAFLLRAAVLSVLSDNFEFGFWLSAGTQAGLLIGPILLLLLSSVPRRHRLIWLMGLLLLNVVLINLIPDNVYRAQMIPPAAQTGFMRHALPTLRAIAALWPWLALLVVARQLVLHQRRWAGIPFMDESAVTHFHRIHLPTRHA